MPGRYVRYSGLGGCGLKPQQHRLSEGCADRWDGRAAEVKVALHAVKGTRGRLERALDGGGVMDEMSQGVSVDDGAYRLLQALL